MKLLNNLSILFFGLLIFLVSCDKRKQTLDEITLLQKNLDSVLSTSAQIAPENKTQTTELILAYTNFAKDYPEDSLAPKFLFEAARLRLFMQDYPSAMQLLSTVSEKYPDDMLAPS
ncbi:MAG: hypothetical protein H7Y00_14975, partial [Fimbriimonadaceae bacterium]|nr:hypothetical protein [Chitinophagales bacterium]